MRLTIRTNQAGGEFGDYTVPSDEFMAEVMYMFRRSHIYTAIFIRDEAGDLLFEYQKGLRT